jgi:Flp pilus assembly protein CpaB
MRRSNNIVVIGAAIFAIGALLVFLGLKSQSKPVAKPQSAPIAATTPATQVRTVTSGAAAAVGQTTTYTIPKGMQAVSIEVPSVAGLAGYAKAGDMINMYATVRNQQTSGRLKTPYVKLVLQNVKVLDVRSPAPGTGGSSVYLLALDVKQAEEVIFWAKYESLWLAIVTPQNTPIVSTGRSYQNAP